MLGIVCNNYFIPAVECICEDLNISRDVAAATFMAVSGTIPELFTNLISTFITDSPMGLGAIIGSLLYNTLGVAAVASLATISPVQINWFPLGRDCMILFINSALLTGFIWDGQVTWYEAMTMVICAVLYFITLFQNKRIERLVKSVVEDKWNCFTDPKYNLDAAKENTTVAGAREGPTPRLSTISNSPSVVSAKAKTLEEPERVVAPKPDPPRTPKSLYKIPNDTRIMQFWFFYSWPIQFFLRYLVPSPKYHRRWYPLTFIMCIVLIGGIAFMVFWMIALIGYTFYIPESVMGLTLLSWGSCMPEAVACVLVVRKELESGNGEMPIQDARHEVHINKTKRQYWFPFNDPGDDSECPKNGGSSIEDFPDDLFTQEQRRQGAIILHIICTIYFFTITAMVINGYYIPCIECICEDLKISPDVAAATFMATATAMPEFFTNTISIFLTDSDMGIGTVIGSMMFNILGVSSIVCFFSREPYLIDWFPISRDSFLYLVHAACLTAFAWDNKIMWWGTVVMCILVINYYIVMILNSRIQNFVVSFVEKRCTCCTIKRPEFEEQDEASEIETKPRKSEKVVHISTISTVFDPPTKPTSEPPTEPATPVPPRTRASVTSNPNPNPRTSILSNIIRRPSVSPSADSQISDEFPPRQVDPRRPSIAVLKPPITKPFVLWNMPKSSVGRRIWWLYTWPIRFVLTFTVPSPKRMRRFYPLTFIMCIVWIAINSYMIFWMLTVIGYTFYIPESIMGMTFLSFGGCTPEAITGFILTRKGMGGMSIANAIGSSSVAMLLSLGLPWFIRTMVDGAAYSGAYIALKSSGIQYIIATLLLVITIAYTIIAIGKFRIRKLLGPFLIFFYVFFITMAILVEMDVFIGGIQC
ncbi:sodium/potassium/calcium exchanger 4-like [Phlebotomus papatasi]|uniref:sodium/potassium/calcium exchanger 4-like n=1 Tax=Phlebotomus papatasi TaxID=29031 RepID=UPI002483AED4|nr:sodium/potassium/calcium exchanger 4-like [Phlebotomus papatasi]